MPKKPIDYSKTIIYKFVCKNIDVKDLYVGHTTNWRQRKNCHKSSCINSNSKKYNLKVYQTIRENGGWDNWDMIEIEKYPCNDEREASSRERQWYEQLHAELNMIVPNRTFEQWRQDNKEIIKQKKKEWNKNNKQYYIDYRKKTKEKTKQYNKEYQKKNKIEIYKIRKQKIFCECGAQIRKTNITIHQQTKKHQRLLSSKNE